MIFFHLRHPQKSQGFSGMSAAASSGGHFVHSLLGGQRTYLTTVGELPPNSAIALGRRAKTPVATEVTAGLSSRPLRTVRSASKPPPFPAGTPDGSPGTDKGDFHGERIDHGFWAGGPYRRRTAPRCGPWPCPTRRWPGAGLVRRAPLHAAIRKVRRWLQDPL